MIDEGMLGKAFKEMKSRGIGIFMKDIAKNPEMREMFRKKVEPMWGDFVQKYNVEEVETAVEDGVVKATLYVTEDENRDEMVKNLLNFIEDLKTHWLFKMVVSEYEIKKIHCDKVDEGVYLELWGNESLGETVNELKGGMVDGEPESGEEGDGEEGDESGEQE